MNNKPLLVFKKGRYTLNTLIMSYPLLYFPLARLFPRSRNQVVNKGMHLVIEGFPRSGNTFSVAAFKYSQGDSIKIAHHLHVPAQIIQAVRWKIPAVVLIRNPRDAVISLKIRTPFITIRQALRNYNSFYNSLVNYRGGFILGAFDKVIADFGAIIEKVNKRFKTNYKSFEHTKSNLDAVFNIIEEMDMANRNKKNITERTVARPSKKRENLKTKFVREFDKPNIIDLYRKALDIYQSFVDDIAL